MDTRNIRELTEFLDQEGKESFFSVMLDMYGRGKVDDAHYSRGQDPLEVCPWFDATGYYQEYQPGFWNWWIRGGVRRRACRARERPYLANTSLTVLAAGNVSSGCLRASHARIFRAPQ